MKRGVKCVHMIAKLIMGICIVAFTTFCGYLFSRKFRQRSDFIQQFKEFNERFLSEIAFRRRPIKAFIEAYSYKGEFDKLLSVYCNGLEKGCGLSLGMDLKKEYSFLKEEDRQVINDYFLMLGKGDSFSQKGYFATSKDALEKLYVEAENNCKKYVHLYIKLGFLCGLTLLILLI